MGEEVEVRTDVAYDWLSGYIYVCSHPIQKGKHIVIHILTGMIGVTVFVRQSLEIHTFTTEQAKQDLAKLHNLNVNQIKITE